RARLRIARPGARRRRGDRTRARFHALDARPRRGERRARRKPLPARSRARLAAAPGCVSRDARDGARLSRDARRRRTPHPPAPEAGAGAPEGRELWIFGDSFSYGWSVDDAQAYPWLLQRAFPGHRVVNFAVGGYGTLQALLELRAALRDAPAPALVVLAHNF